MSDNQNVKENYEQKYLKYKNKYLSLKGSPDLWMLRRLNEIILKKKDKPETAEDNNTLVYMDKISSLGEVIDLAKPFIKDKDYFRPDWNYHYYLKFMQLLHKFKNDTLTKDNCDCVSFQNIIKIYQDSLDILKKDPKFSKYANVKIDQDLINSANEICKKCYDKGLCNWSILSGYY